MNSNSLFTNNKAEIESGFKLYNLDGVLIMEGVISNDITSIDVSTLRTGQYILKIHQNGKENTRYVIIN